MTTSDYVIAAGSLHYRPAAGHLQTPNAEGAEGAEEKHETNHQDIQWHQESVKNERTLLVCLVCLVVIAVCLGGFLRALCVLRVERLRSTKVRLVRQNVPGYEPPSMRKFCPVMKPVCTLQM